jgi:hypothetical protein
MFNEHYAVNGRYSVTSCVMVTYFIGVTVSVLMYWSLCTYSVRVLSESQSLNLFFNSWLINFLKAENLAEIARADEMRWFPNYLHLFTALLVTKRYICIEHIFDCL